jgi:putative transcriptional regulator
VAGEAGVYMIRCLASDEVYVGSSADLAGRLAYHRVALRGGNHHNRRRQSAWDRWGEAAFLFEVAEVVGDDSTLGDAEAAWIDQLYARTPGRGFNSSSAYCGHAVAGAAVPLRKRRLVVASALKRAVANRLRELRQQHGLTQERLAADLEVTRHTILALEVGRYVPSIELALRLAAYFDRPRESIFWLEPAEDRSIRGLAPVSKGLDSQQESEARHDGRD